MKKLKIILFFILTISLSSNAQKTAFSKEALDVTFSTTTQSTASLQDILTKHKGKKVLIDVWASNDPSFISAIPQIAQLQTENPNVDYVYICNGKLIENWKTSIDKTGLKGDHYFLAKESKGVFFREIDLDWLPRFIIINPNGQIILYRGIETDIAKIGAILKA
jgi:thiol-disulfide isomerase/thioredoxin